MQRGQGLVGRTGPLSLILSTWSCGSKIAAAKMKGDIIAKRTKRGQREAVASGKKLGPQSRRGPEGGPGGQIQKQAGPAAEFTRHYARERARGAKTDQEIAEAFNRGAM